MTNKDKEEDDEATKIFLKDLLYIQYIVFALCIILFIYGVIEILWPLS